MTESLYPIRYISEKTGVKPITLRAWEKRYNLITPQRTEKGHRLYSDDDIKTIQKTITLLNYGYAIREVPALLNEHDGHIVVRDKKSHHMVSFDKLNKLVKEYRIDASIKEIEDLMSLYSPESYAQIIHPAMMKSLNKDSFIHIDYAEVIKEIDPSNKKIDEIMTKYSDKKGLVLTSSKSRCFEILQNLSEENKNQLQETIKNALD